MRGLVHCFKVSPTMMSMKANLATTLVVFLTLRGDCTEAGKCNTCQQPTPDVLNGAFEVSSTRSFATLKCDPGYALLGQKTITCASRRWSHPEAKCLECIVPTPEVANGAFELSITGSNATLKCDPGYDLLGEETITCTNSQWSQTEAKCQGLSGTHFVTVFPSTVQQEEGNSRQMLITASNVTTNVNISIGDNTESFVVTDFTVRDFPTNLTLTSSDVVNDTVLVVSSDLPITVHIVVTSIGDEKSLGSFMALPSESLSTEYVLITTKRTPQFNVIALEDNTQVTLDTVSDVSKVLTLNKNEVYTLFYDNTTELTGKTITSTEKVAVISGGVYACVPSSSGVSDMNVVQMIGVQDWKKSCILGPYKPRNGYQFKVVASENETTVNISTAGYVYTVQIDRGIALTALLTPNISVLTFIWSDKPILIAQFSLNNGVGDDVMNADSSMTLCVPPEEYLGVYRFFAPAPNSDSYVRIIIKSAYATDLRLNDMPLAPFEEITNVEGPDGTYDIVYIEVTTDLYYVLKTTSGQTFGADLYGVNGIAKTQFTHTLGRKIL